MTDEIEKLVEEAMRVICCPNGRCTYGRTNCVSGKHRPDAERLVTLAYAAGRKAGREEAKRCVEKSEGDMDYALFAIRALPEG